MRKIHRNNSSIVCCLPIIHILYLSYVINIFPVDNFKVDDFYLKISDIRGYFVLEITILSIFLVVLSIVMIAQRL